MPKESKSGKIEKEKRIRTVQEYILLDYPANDIVAQCIQKWGVCERQAKRYIDDAHKNFQQITEKTQPAAA